MTNLESKAKDEILQDAKGEILQDMKSLISRRDAYKFLSIGLGTILLLDKMEHVVDGGLGNFSDGLEYTLGYGCALLGAYFWSQGVNKNQSRNSSISTEKY